MEQQAPKNVLYYSMHCGHCRDLLSILGKSPVQRDFHYMNIDNRERGPDGQWVINLQNGTNVPLPKGIKNVPSVMMLNRGNMVISGIQVKEFIKHLEDEKSRKQQKNDIAAFDIGGFGGGGVVSDTFSFLDTDPQDMLCKGNGGMRQLHNYSTINSFNVIETPPENYESDKIKGSIDTDKIQRERSAVYR